MRLSLDQKRYARRNGSIRVNSCCSETDSAGTSSGASGEIIRSPSEPRRTGPSPSANTVSSSPRGWYSSSLVAARARAGPEDLPISQQNPSRCGCGEDVYRCPSLCLSQCLSCGRVVDGLVLALGEENTAPTSRENGGVFLPDTEISNGAQPAASPFPHGVEIDPAHPGRRPGLREPAST